MPKLKTSIQIGRRVKCECKEINEMNKKFQESDDESNRRFLSNQISMSLIRLRELKWCSGINYDKLIK